ncbi:MAG: ABC transporter permease [Nocardiopsaceae bacterium]|nr:ABC transporter permease [Nocardiopsaceae bacterium]
MTAEAGAAAAGPSSHWGPAAPAAGAVLRSPMLRLVGRRLLAAIPVLWGVTLLTFAVMNVLPGDAAQQLLGANATPAEVHALEVKLHLNEPFWVRYGHWLGAAVTGHLGSSIQSGQTVTSTLAQRLPLSIELLAYVFLLTIVISVPLAVLAARKPGGVTDRLSMMLSMGGLSIAPYVLALLLVLVFAVILRVFPAIGYVSPGESIPGNIRSLTLPAISIGFPVACVYTRLLRADIVEQMQSEDYVITARAKGVSQWQILVRHVLRNSVFGLITLIGLNLGTLVGALVIIEPIFSLPGIGQALLQAINSRDIPVAEAVTLVFAVVVVLANLLTDLLYAVLDPRIRYGRPTA